MIKCINLIKLENISVCCESKHGASNMPSELTALDLDPPALMMFEMF